MCVLEYRVCKVGFPSSFFRVSASCGLLVWVKEFRKLREGLVKEGVKDNRREREEMESVVSRECSETYFSAPESIESFCSAESCLYSVDREGIAAAAGCAGESLPGKGEHFGQSALDKATCGEGGKVTQGKLPFGSVVVSTVSREIKQEVMQEPKQGKAVKKSLSQKLTLLKFSFSKGSKSRNEAGRDEGSEGTKGKESSSEELYGKREGNVNTGQDIMENVRTEDVVITTQVDSQDEFEGKLQIGLGVDSPISVAGEGGDENTDVALNNSTVYMPAIEEPGNFSHNEIGVTPDTPTTGEKALDLSETPHNGQETITKCDAVREVDVSVKASSSDGSAYLPAPTKDEYNSLNMQTLDTAQLANKQMSHIKDPIVSGISSTEPFQSNKERGDGRTMYGLTKEDIEMIREKLDTTLSGRGKPLEDAFNRSIHSFDDPAEYFLSMEAALIGSDSSLQVLKILSLELGEEHPMVKKMQRKKHLAEVQDIDMFLKQAIDDNGGGMSRRIFTENPEQYATTADYYKSLENTASNFSSSLIPALKQKLGSDHPLVVALTGSADEGNTSATVELPVSQGGILTENGIDMDPSFGRFTLHESNVNNSVVRDEASVRKSSCWGCACLRP